MCWRTVLVVCYSEMCNKQLSFAVILLVAACWKCRLTSLIEHDASWSIRCSAYNKDAQAVASQMGTFWQPKMPRVLKCLKLIINIMFRHIYCTNSSRVSYNSNYTQAFCTVCTNKRAKAARTWNLASRVTRSFQRLIYRQYDIGTMSCFCLKECVISNSVNSIRNQLNSIVPRRKLPLLMRVTCAWECRDSFQQPPVSLAVCTGCYVALHFPRNAVVGSSGYRFATPCVVRFLFLFNTVA